MKKTLLMLALVAGITSFAQNAQAELITINIGPTGFNIGGINGGVSYGTYREVANFPIFGSGTLFLDNAFNVSGLSGDGLKFADGITPEKFVLNELIDSTSDYFSFPGGLFKDGDSVSPDFGPGSYMGFQTIQGNYGWLEVTWTASSSQFQIFSGAYESTPNVAIRAGAGPTAPIPEPGTWAAMAIFAGGAAFTGWRRRKSAKVAA